MRWAVLTDLHANREALEAVMGHAATQSIDRFAFLGDFVGYGADPGWVVDQVIQRVLHGHAVAVKGNHDAGAVEGPPPGMVPHARDAILWTQAQLSPDQLRFLEALPYTATAGDCLFTHANAAQPEAWSYITSRSDAVRSLQATSRHFVFCGHTHEPALYHMSPAGKAGDFRPVTGVPIPMTAHRQWLAVVGSVGQPRDANPAAAYAVFDTQKGQLTFHRVPYDVDAAAEKILEAGLPTRLAERLRHGL